VTSFFSDKEKAGQAKKKETLKKKALAALELMEETKTMQRIANRSGCFDSGDEVSCDELFSDKKKAGHAKKKHVSKKKGGALLEDISEIKTLQRIANVTGCFVDGEEVDCADFYDSGSRRAGHAKKKHVSKRKIAAALDDFIEKKTVQGTDNARNKNVLKNKALEVLEEISETKNLQMIANSSGCFDSGDEVDCSSFFD